MSKNRWLIIVITVFLVFMVTLTFFGKGAKISESINPRWIISGIIFSICVAVAYFMSFDRMFIYAFIFAGAFNLSEIIRENPGFISENGFAYLLASIILLAIGFVYLIKFLKKYPLPGKEVNYDR